MTQGVKEVLGRRHSLSCLDREALQKKVLHLSFGGDGVRGRHFFSRLPLDNLEIMSFV